MGVYTHSFSGLSFKPLGELRTFFYMVYSTPSYFFFFFFTKAKRDFLGAWSLPLWRGMEGWKLPRAADFMKVGETLASFIGGKEYKKEKTKQNKTSCVGQAQLLQRASAGGS